jgi:hypothetical protein
VRAAAAFTLLLWACGASVEAPRSSNAGAPRAEARWQALDLEGALEAARAGGTAADREIGARAALALGRPAEAAELLGGSHRLEHLRLRGQAEILLGRWGRAAAALREAGRRSRAEDPWTDDRAIIAARMADRGDTSMEGAGRSSLPLAPGRPLPFVEVEVDGRRTWALVSTGVDLAIVDRRRRARPGVLDELRLGALRLRAVPHTVRDLADLDAAAPGEVGLVVGLHLLRRLHPVLDGPAGALEVGAEAPPRPAEPFEATMLTPSGSFLAVPGEVPEGTLWLTVDTGTPSVVAPGPAWGASLEGPRVPRLRVGDLVLEDLPADLGLLGESHARAVGAPVAGLLGWGLLGAMRVVLDFGARRLRVE